MSDLIEKALQTSTDTKVVLAGEQAIDSVAEVFTATFGERPAVVVGDERTMAVAGNAVIEALKAGGVEVADPYVFPGDPELYAKYELRAAPRRAAPRGRGARGGRRGHPERHRQACLRRTRPPLPGGARPRPWTATPPSAARSPSTATSRP